MLLFRLPSGMGIITYLIGHTRYSASLQLVFLKCGLCFLDAVHGFWMGFMFFEMRLMFFCMQFMFFVCGLCFFEIHFMFLLCFRFRLYYDFID